MARVRYYTNGSLSTEIVLETDGGNPEFPLSTVTNVPAVGEDSYFKSGVCDVPGAFDGAYYELTMQYMKIAPAVTVETFTDSYPSDVPDGTICYHVDTTIPENSGFYGRIGGGWSFLSGSGGGVSSHNTLSGIQGGVSGNYYHLGLSEYRFTNYAARGQIGSLSFLSVPGYFGDMIPHYQFDGYNEGDSIASEDDMVVLSAGTGTVTASDYGARTCVKINAPSGTGNSGALTFSTATPVSTFACAFTIRIQNREGRISLGKLEDSAGNTLEMYMDGPDLKVNTNGSLYATLASGIPWFYNYTTMAVTYDVATSTYSIVPTWSSGGSFPLPGMPLIDVKSISFPVNGVREDGITTGIATAYYDNITPSWKKPIDTTQYYGGWIERLETMGLVVLDNATFKGDVVNFEATANMGGNIIQNIGFSSQDGDAFPYSVYKAHENDISIHTPLNDGGYGTDVLWSSQKIVDYLNSYAALTGATFTGQLTVPSLVSSGTVTINTGDLYVTGGHVILSDLLETNGNNIDLTDGPNPSGYLKGNLYLPKVVGTLGDLVEFVEQGGMPSIRPSTSDSANGVGYLGTASNPWHELNINIIDATQETAKFMTVGGDVNSWCTVPEPTFTNSATTKAFVENIANNIGGEYIGALDIIPIGAATKEIINHREMIKIPRSTSGSGFTARFTIPPDKSGGLPEYQFKMIYYSDAATSVSIYGNIYHELISHDLTISRPPGYYSGSSSGNIPLYPTTDQWYISSAGIGPKSLQDQYAGYTIDITFESTSSAGTENAFIGDMWVEKQ